jgi:esterase/lipase superfamily enzyme
MATPNNSATRAAVVATMIKVRFATNRNQTGGSEIFGSGFRKPPPLFVTGTIDVYHRGGDPVPNWVPDTNSLHIDPVSKAQPSTIAQSIEIVASTNNAITAFIEKTAVKETKEKKTEKNPGIVFLPGFASTFIDAMSNSAQIASAYGANQVFCFSWPSQGKFGPVEYSKDRDSAYESGTAIALALSVVFSKLLSMEKSKRPGLNIACHSMGNRALSAAIRYIAIGAPKLLSTNYFKHALLMAADEDNNALAEPNKLEPLLRLADNIDVYTNEHDLAMFLSWIANSLVVPLGWYGPADFGTLPGKVILVDCTDVGDTYENNGSTDWGHQYFRNSRPVTADVRQVLQGIPPNKISPRIPDRQFPERKFVIPFSSTSAWAHARGYQGAPSVP